MSVDANSWNNTISPQIKELGDCANGYYWLCREMSRRNDMKHEKYTLPIKIISATISLLSFVNVQLQQYHTTSKVINILIALLSFIITILVIINDTKDFKKKSSDFRKLSHEFRSLANDIQRQFNMPPNKRENAETHYKRISADYLRLENNKFDIDEDLIVKYAMVAHEIGIRAPEVLEDISHIRISEERTRSDITSKKTVNTFIENLKKNYEKPKFKKYNSRYFGSSSEKKTISDPVLYRGDTSSSKDTSSNHSNSPINTPSLRNVNDKYNDSTMEFELNRV